MALLDDAAADLQRRGHLSLLDRELPREDRELPHLLESGEVAERGLYAPLKGGDDHGMGDRLGTRLRANAKIRAEAREGFLLRDDEGRNEAARVTDDDGLGDEAGRAEGALERLRGDVLAARRDDQILLAIGDREEAVAVESADVAGAEPAVL